MVETCLILHNMMVEVRLDQEQQEDSGWYDMMAEEEQEAVDASGDDNDPVKDNQSDNQSDNVQAWAAIPEPTTRQHGSCSPSLARYD